MALANQRKDVIWQREDTVASYGKSRPAIPFADEQFDLIERVLRAHEAPVRSLLDLGCGDGIATQAIQDRYPVEHAVLVDFSPPMLGAARARFAESEVEITIVEGDLAGQEWVAVAGQRRPFDLAISRYAIHHLTDERKRSIYRDIYGLLAPGGWFLNIEHVKSVNDRYQKAFDQLLIDGIHRLAGDGQSVEDVERAYRARQDAETNILAPATAQCEWLSEIGFTDVDCLFKALELAVFGGRKPIA